MLITLGYLAKGWKGFYEQRKYCSGKITAPNTVANGMHGVRCQHKLHKLISTKIPGNVLIMSNEDCYFYVLFMLLLIE